MRSEARAFGPERLLGHLDDDLLPFFQELFDFRLGSFVALAIATTTLAHGRAIAARRGHILVGFQAVEFLEGGDDVRHIEETVAFETEVNERRLHAGKDFRDPAFVEIANDATLMLAFDEDLGNLIVLEDRDPCFVGARGDDHLLGGHARSSNRTVRRAPDGSPLRAPAGTSAASTSAQSSPRS